MGYLFIIGLILILATFFGITMLFDYKRIKKKCNQAITEVKSWSKDNWKEIK